VRMRLKEALLSEYHFVHVDHVNSIKEAQDFLRYSDAMHLIFISYRFNEQEVLNFISHAKLSPGGVDAAYIMIVEALKKTHSDMARWLASDVDSILQEPYSVDELVEVTCMGRDLHHSRRQAREVLAAEFLIRDLVKYLDLLAFMRSRGQDGSRSKAKMKGMMELLSRFHPAARENYFTRLIDVFTSQPYPEQYRRHSSYNIPSARVREKVEAVLLETIEKETKNAAQERSEVIARLMKW
jgi:hypothetical protein